jgi:hypothetical protein
LLAFSQLSREDAARELLDERAYVESVLAQEPADIDLPGTPSEFALRMRTGALAAAEGAHMLLSGRLSEHWPQRGR